MGSKRIRKLPPPDTTDISKLIIPEDVQPIPTKLIRVLFENKFTDKGIEKILKKNYGNAYRDAIHEIHVQIGAEKTGDRPGGDLAKTATEGAENTGKSGTSPPVTSGSTNTSRTHWERNRSTSIRIACVQAGNSGENSRTDSRTGAGPVKHEDAQNETITTETRTSTGTNTSSTGTSTGTGTPTEQLQEPI